MPHFCFIFHLPSPLFPTLSFILLWQVRDICGEISSVTPFFRKHDSLKEMPRLLNLFS